MRKFVQLRHRPPSPKPTSHALVLVCSHLNSRANVSSIARLAGCLGLDEVFLAGSTKVDKRIEHVTLRRRRTLPPFLAELRRSGYRLVGLEQTTGSQPLFDYAFDAQTALVVGNERRGL